MNGKQRATTVRGAKRVLANAKRNHAYAMAAGVPAWVRAATAARVLAAETELRRFQDGAGNGGR